MRGRSPSECVEWLRELPTTGVLWLESPASHKGDPLKKLALLGAGVGLAVGALLVSHTSHAADHLDSPGVMTNRMADLNDVYAWMTSDDKPAVAQLAASK